MSYAIFTGVIDKFVAKKWLKALYYKALSLFLKYEQKTAHFAKV
ncbi:hypothetical protein K756_07195 [Glaesserella parasuis ZJ0906]|uniref:Uncharacterized protein n=1 Tax=Glaesserella parasuis ZJ0906 TaxID=1322346 RepID=A0A806J461_GLAPU|nr:hypothetical protein K756_07195 [Glaesserella parasuis ZJ0906]EMY46990.1 hypothetical protein OE7_01442 [Glaesserella parasuis gx033]EPZ99105.1 hypothetical protein HPSNAG_2304 [Glaesserella parasuis str. Nagasaki]EQA07328.1 hypothetical protein HPS8415995_2238 [Glaesserella parasuis 84-15995]